MQTTISPPSAKRDKGLEKANLWNDKRYVFVWYNNENQPRGLMITHKIEEDGVTYLDCPTRSKSPGGFLACDAEAFNGLLFFAKSAFSSDYERSSASPSRPICT